MCLPGMFGANRWALSQRTHPLPGGFFGGSLVGTFKEYPAWTHQVKWGQIVSEPTMNSQWACWVSDPLPPVTAPLWVFSSWISTRRSRSDCKRPLRKPVACSERIRSIETRLLNASLSGWSRSGRLYGATTQLSICQYMIRTLW